MVHRTGSGGGETKQLHLALVFVAATAASRHQLGKERGIVDMEFVWRDPYYRTVFGMHVPDHEYISAARRKEVVVEFIPVGHRSERRTWKGR